MQHSTASAASQLEHWSTAYREIPTSGSLGTVLGGMWENPDISPLKNASSHGGARPHLHVISCPPPRVHMPNRILNGSGRAHGHYRQTDQQTD